MTTPLAPVTINNMLGEWTVRKGRTGWLVICKLPEEQCMCNIFPTLNKAMNYVNILGILCGVHIFTQQELKTLSARLYTVIYTTQD